MRISRESLEYDIANLAFIIRDSVETERHGMHCLADICQEGNIDRVRGVLIIAYSEILTVLSPLLASPCKPSGCFHKKEDREKECQEYFAIPLSVEFQRRIKPEIKMKIRETAREYMICRVLADWLTITYPEQAEIWKKKYEAMLLSLTAITAGVCCGFRRRIEPL